jgi:hypothetical protein
MATPFAESELQADPSIHLILTGKQALFPDANPSKESASHQDIS